MDFVMTRLEKLFAVDGIFTIHYFEFGKDYKFLGERHDFWETVYIDKGEAEICMDGEWKKADCGDMIFHAPMQFHNIRANGVIAPNIAIFTFACNSPAMEFFNDMVIRIGAEEKALIGKIITLGKKAFVTPLDDPFTTGLERSGEPAYEQLIGIYIEELLLRLYLRSRGESIKQAELENENSTAAEAARYMKENIGKPLCISDISRAIMKSESELKRAFRNETGTGVMTYFRNMKITAAKQMLRSGKMNVTEISEALGYESIHYFSRQFKTMTGMTPSEYMHSIKSRLDGDLGEKHQP